MMRFCLVGYGAIGRLRAQALMEMPNAELAFVVEPVAERRADAARLGVATAASLDQPGVLSSVDAVIVSTPPHLHLAPCLAALAAGKPVLCEKPLAPTVAEGEAIVNAARRAGVVLGTGFNYRFYPAVARARELIAAGRIGRVDHVKSFSGHPGGPEFTHPWVHDPAIMGGGALMDNGIHVADLTLHFLGAAVEGRGFATEGVWGFGGSEDNGYVIARTADNKVGMLHASWSAWPGYRWSVEIGGTHGSLDINYPPMWLMHVERPEGAAKKGRRHIYAFPAFQVQERLKSYRWTVVQSFVAEHRDFMARVAGRGGHGASGVDGLRAVELVQAAYTTRPAGPLVAQERIEVVA